jgi:hypothetical protein
VAAAAARRGFCFLCSVRGSRFVFHKLDACRVSCATFYSPHTHSPRPASHSGGLCSLIMCKHS